jgi:hypothetical protein
VRRLSRRAVVASLAVALALRGEPAALRPRSNKPLPASVGPAAAVAWSDGTTLLVGGNGVRALDLDSGSIRVIVPGEPLPSGLSMITSIHTDGQSLVATSAIQREQFIARVASGKRVAARRTNRFYLIDSAVSGDRLFVLGWPLSGNAADNPKGIALWSSKLDTDLGDLQPLHAIAGGPVAVAIFNDSVYPHGGAVTRGPDGGVCAITAAEPGVYCYSAQRKLLRVYGSLLRELVIERMHDVNFTFAEDPGRRYREIINVQPTVDGLVMTADGPAILVRLARGSDITWELWYPGASKIGARVPLDLSIARAAAHLACDARERRLACVYGMPGASPREYRSYLALFDLPRVTLRE